jgi:peptide/nickel transport system permease protein
VSYARAFTRYAFRRAFTYLASFIVAVIVMFLVVEFSPGSPLHGGSPINPQMYRRMSGLCICNDCPSYCLFICDFIQYLIKAFTFRFGFSISFFPKTVEEVILENLPYTLALLVPAVLVSYVLGNYIGSYIIYRRGELDLVITLASSVLANTPPYILASMLLLALAFHMRLFPVGGTWSVGLKPSLTPQFILDFLWHYTLPFTTTVVTSVFGWYLGMRFICVSELGADYIAYSESLGVKDKILFRYVYRNSLLPQVTGLAISFGTALAGQTIVENIFRWPGSGFVLSRAIGSLDYPVIQGTFAVLTLTLFTANFLVDFIYALIDPRIRLGGGG